MSVQKSQYNGIESVTNAHAVITTDHAFIHEGIAFTVANKMDVAGGKVGAIQLNIPANVAASVTVNMTAATSDLTYTAKAAGSAGNGITVTHIDPAGNNKPLIVSVTANDDITISLATGAAGAITSTAALVKAAVNSDTVASSLVTCEDEGVGSGLVNALATTNLTGGTNAAYVHFKPSKVSATAGPVYVALLENYNFAAAGGAIVPLNRNRMKDYASVLTVKGIADATVVSGTAPQSLDMTVLVGNTTAGKLGSSSSAAEEWVLKAGNTYLITFSNATSPSVTATVGYELFWYEEGGA